MNTYPRRIITIALVVFGTNAVSAGEYVYFAEAPGECNLDLVSYDNQTFSVFVHSGELTDVNGVSFRLESQRFEPQHVVSVSTPPGVTVVEGNLFEGITVSFDPRSLDHDPILIVVLTGHWSGGDVSTHDIVFSRAGGSVNLADFYTNGWSFDCSEIAPLWDPPDTVDVVVDEDQSFSFTAVVSMSAYPPNAQVVALDSGGWVVTPFSQWVLADCAWCAWDVTTVTVPIHIPPEVTDGSLNSITLQIQSFGQVVGERTVVLRANTKVPTEVTTWGAVKAKYE